MLNSVRIKVGHVNKMEYQRPLTKSVAGKYFHLQKYYVRYLREAHEKQEYMQYMNFVMAVLVQAQRLIVKLDGSGFDQNGVIKALAYTNIMKLKR